PASTLRSAPVRPSATAANSPPTPAWPRHPPIRHHPRRVRPAVGGSRLFEGRVLPGQPDAVWSGPDRLDRVGGDDHLVRVVGGFDLLQAGGGGGWGGRAGRGRG